VGVSETNFPFSKLSGYFMKECQDWKEFSANYELYCYKTVQTVVYL